MANVELRVDGREARSEPNALESIPAKKVRIQTGH